MSNVRRITLDWKKLFAFEQADGGRREAEDLCIASRLGAKIGDKVGVKDDPPVETEASRAA